MTWEANFLPSVDFSGEGTLFWGVESLFSGFRVGFSGDLWVLETVRMVDLSGLEGPVRTESSLRRSLVGVAAANASFDATRGRTVRFLSSVLFTSIRRNAWPISTITLVGRGYSWRGCNSFNCADLLMF